MAAGNFNIRRNESDTSAVPNAGTNLDSAWDTLVKDEGSIVSYSNPNFRLNTGIYLIMYSEYFHTDDTTNNERIEIQGEIHKSGTGVIGGYGQDYIRKSSGDQSCVVQGYSIVEVTADNTDYFIRFYRTDNSTAGTVNRVPGYGGVSILQLDDSHNFGLYTANSSEATSGTTVRTLAASTNDRQDTGFSNSSGVVTISTAGRYLVTYSIDVAQTATGREVVSAFIEKNGSTEVIGTRGYSYTRGADGTQDGAVTWIGIIDVEASDTLSVQWSCPTSATFTMPAGGGHFQIWQIPSAADECIVEATTGDYNANADFDWDTNPHIDTGSFTHSAGDSNIDVNQDDHLLVFATFAQVTDSSPQRAVPLIRIKNGEVINNTTAGSAYQRNSSTSNFSCGVAGLIHNVESGGSIRINTKPNAATGALANTKGQFSVLSLDSIWNYTYSFPPTITSVDSDDVVTNTQTNVVITGKHFEASKGSGKVELVENFDYTGTIINQTSIDSWSDTSIQFDVSAGALTDTNCYLAVTNNSGERTMHEVQVGLPPETYPEAVEGMTLAPDHYWKFQNSYNDEIGSATANNTSGGSPTFSSTKKLCRDDTHSLQLDSITDYISPADQSDMNTSAISRRYIGGWFMVDRISQTLSVLYEEGAQVNNIALLNGFGNNPMFQIANANDDYVQTYFDKSIAANRPYHVLLQFNASGHEGGVCRLFVDGVLQSRTNGNPWETTQLDSHSGNITWGHEGTESLKVGDDRGVDATTISFTSPVACNYAHWYSWSNVTLDADDDIRFTLFEKGASAYITISSDTEANMQTALDAYADTIRPDWPCAIKIEECTEGDFELVADNITFDEGCSIDIQYTGADTLTWVTENGSSIDEDKISKPYGGIVTVVNAPVVKLTIKQASDGAAIVGARVLLEADSGGDLAAGDEIIEGTTDSNGEISVNFRYTNDQPVVGKARAASGSTKYKPGSFSGTITSDGLDGVILLIKD